MHLAVHGGNVPTELMYSLDAQGRKVLCRARVPGKGAPPPVGRPSPRSPAPVDALVKCCAPITESCENAPTFPPAQFQLGANQNFRVWPWVENRPIEGCPATLTCQELNANFGFDEELQGSSGFFQGCSGDPGSCSFPRSGCRSWIGMFRGRTNRVLRCQMQVDAYVDGHLAGNGGSPIANISFVAQLLAFGGTERRNIIASPFRGFSTVRCPGCPSSPTLTVQAQGDVHRWDIDFTSNTTFDDNLYGMRFWFEWQAQAAFCVCGPNIHAFPPWRVSYAVNNVSFSYVRP